MARSYKHSTIMRMKLGYSESLFGFSVADKPMFEVVAENLANWLGHDSVLSSQSDVKPKLPLS